MVGKKKKKNSLRGHTEEDACLYWQLPTGNQGCIPKLELVIPIRAYCKRMNCKISDVSHEQSQKHHAE